MFHFLLRSHIKSHFSAFILFPPVLGGGCHSLVCVCKFWLSCISVALIFFILFSSFYFSFCFSFLRNNNYVELVRFFFLVHEVEWKWEWDREWGLVMCVIVSMRYVKSLEWMICRLCVEWNEQCITSHDIMCFDLEKFVSFLRLQGLGEWGRGKCSVV